jgi:hypothetical protein
MPAGNTTRFARAAVSVSVLTPLGMGFPCDRRNREGRRKDAGQTSAPSWLPANPGPSSVPWSFVVPLPLPSCQPAATSRGSLLTRGTTHRGPSPPRQPWASEPCLLAQPQPALPRVGSRPLPRGKPYASRGVDRPSKACAAAISLHHRCEPEAPGGRGVQNLVTLSRNWTGRILPTRLHVSPGDPCRPPVKSRRRGAPLSPRPPRARGARPVGTCGNPTQKTNKNTWLGDAHAASQREVAARKIKHLQDVVPCHLKPGPSCSSRGSSPMGNARGPRAPPSCPRMSPEVGVLVGRHPFLRSCTRNRAIRPGHPGP